MARVKRAAAAVTVPQSQAEAAEALAAIGAAQRSLEVIQAALDEQVAALKAAAEAEAAPHRAVVEQRTRGLEVWAAANRGLAKGKTITLPTGTLSWRVRPPAVRLSDVKAVLAELAVRGLTAFIRTKHEVDKEAMLAAPDVAASIPGVTIVTQVEDFVVEPTALTLAEAGGPA
jgi:phage host-nuclease inhibitor protein Gam